MIKYVLTNCSSSEYIDDENIKVIETSCFPIDVIRNGDVLYGNSCFYVWGGNDKLPSWVLEHIPPIVPHKRKIYDFFTDKQCELENYLIKIGTLTSLRGTEEYNITNANTGSRMMAKIVGGNFVNRDGYDTLHPLWGKQSDKAKKVMFQKTTGYTSEITMKKNLSAVPSNNIDFDVLFLIQTQTPLSFGFAIRDDIIPYYKHTPIKTSLKLPTDMITFIIHPKRGLRVEDYKLNGLPRSYDEITTAILERSVIEKL